ncbi:hypothetical protein BUALT_Bualt09G0027600 [Buddleja alternifolia]|uniref:RNase H type-1 domain-containing protein n=1 Tax=Buddleja alternifolia TaxID=168488 RepID=A0AAV6X0M1_9LAMI|nr:hypothetical protein BUALT_Bualt09G0027600 [Buddleja alternifolia]
MHALLVCPNAREIMDFSMKLGENSITTTELLKLRKGLEMAWERRLQKLIVEVDSKIVVKLVFHADTITLLATLLRTVAYFWLSRGKLGISYSSRG